MANNTTLDPGTGGDTIATDDVAGVKYQRVKLVNGTEDATDAIPGDATNGLDVDVTRLPSGTVAGSSSLPAGTNNIGDVDVLTLPSLPAGTNNIGDVDVLTLPGTAADGATGLPTTTVVVSGYDGTNVQTIHTDTAGDVQVDVASALPAGDNNIGNVDVVTLPNVTNAGTFAVQESGSALTALQLIDDTVFVDDAAFTVATSKVNAVGMLADQTSTDSVNEGDIGIPRITLDRKQIVTVAPSNDTEGLDIFRSLDLDETEEDVKTSAGKLYGWFIYNDGATEAYVKLYNATAASVTVGSTTPVMTIPIPAGSAANVEFSNGIAFSTAICAAATTGVADADTGAPAANQVVANFFYK